MAVRYSKQVSKTGAAVGTIIAIPKPSTWTDSSSLSTESSNWNIANLYPGWIECAGQTLNVSEYRSLYSVIGNTYGGTAGVDFKLPDYRSKKLMGTGFVDGNTASGASLTPNLSPAGGSGGSYNIPGSVGGTYSISTIRQLPPSSEITPGAPTSPATIGGTASDTFVLGTYTSSGFSNTINTIQPNFSGNLSISVGSSNGTDQRLVGAAPAHAHQLRHVTRGNTAMASGDPYFAGGNPGAGFMPQATGSVITFDRGGSPVRQHSHYIAWSITGTPASYGHDEGAGSSGLVNGVIVGTVAHGSSYGAISNNIGTTINKTIDLVNQGGVTINSATVTLKNSSRIDFDNSMNVRLQSAEEIPLMSPYFRVKYIIKAY